MGKSPPTSTPTEDAGSIVDLLKAVAQTPEATRPRLPVGVVLHDTHRLVRFIGEGGMGAVYEAVHVRLSKRRFAIKILKAMQTGSTTPYARFKREAEIATSLGHPNIVDVLDFYETEDGRPCMVMELLQGEDLESLLHRVGRLEAPQLLPILKQVGAALQAVHDRSVVHRDLKPANIFLVTGDRGQVKLLDFGISKIRDEDTVLTSNVAMIGTPQYMSPEQSIGQSADVDHTTDIFALGIICYQALSGRLPFDAPTIPGVLYKICHEEPPSLSELVEALPPGVAPVLALALAKERSKRFSRVDAFVAALERAFNEAATLPPPVPPVLTPDPEHAAAPALETLPQLPLAPPRWRPWLAGALIVAALTGLGLWLQQRSQRAGQSGRVDAAVRPAVTPPQTHDAAVDHRPPPAATDADIGVKTAPPAPRRPQRTRRPGRDEPLPQLDGGATRKRIYDKLDDSRRDRQPASKKKIYDNL